MEVLDMIFCSIFRRSSEVLFMEDLKWDFFYREHIEAILYVYKNCKGFSIYNRPVKSIKAEKCLSS